MKLISLVAALVMSSSAMAYDFIPQKPVVKQKTDMVVPFGGLVLDTGNIITLRGEVDDSSVGEVIKQMYSIKGNDITLFLDTPGGGVVSGLQLIDTMQALVAAGKNITCISQFAASMGFVITQACPIRIIMNTSILMQHQPSWGLRGGPQANNLSFIKFLTRMTDVTNAAQAKRLGMTQKAFEDMVHDDVWMLGDDIIKAKAADEIRPVMCSEKLAAGLYQQTFQTFFGPVLVTWSNCPLISGPLKIEMGKGVTQEDLQKILNKTSNFSKDTDYIKNLNK